jgi:hypothetical protein
MNAWILRALGLGGLVVVVRLLLGYAMLAWPTHSGWLRLLMFVVVLAAGLAWGFTDGRADRERFSDPEQGADLTMLWLKAAVVAGLGSGLVCWLLALIPSVEMGGNSIGFELTSGAAFIVLVVFLPALLGVALGRYVVNRRSERVSAA